ncbi:hypothetical protein A3D58_00785 [Candidatus Uhrbacteria bacterium RIFCSPHIGHO2_02_FULL_46_47]|nr:MAG: hypothetical protein A3D58_00785 [Candidatus Uhrbacteria bacterium RIFCSPHIGHO2_02_FULL_46_47]
MKKLRGWIISAATLLGLLLAYTSFAQVSAEVEGLALTAADPRLIAARIIRVALGFLGIVVLTLIIYGGFLWMTAAGNEETIEKAKKVLRNAIIGLIIILTSFAITQFVINKLIEATRGPREVIIATPCLGPDCPEGLPKDAFIVKGITPRGASTIRNIVVRVTLSKKPTGDLENIRSTIEVRRKASDGDEGVLVETDPIVNDYTIELRPRTACPAPNTDRKCFDAETDFTVEAKEKLLSADGKKLICGGLAPSCTGAFHSGSLVDVAPPTVTLEYPDEGEPVAVGTCVRVQAKVTDDGGVSLVKFYMDGQLITGGSIMPSNDTTPTDTVLEIPCWYPPPPAPKARRLTARAYDVDDNNTLSAPVAVMVRPLHCFNDIKDDDEDQVDCDSQVNGPSGCGLCNGASCTQNIQCSGGACINGICAEPTKITGVSPGDGRPGTFVALAGYSFGSQAGTVVFKGTSAPEDDKVASAPQACAGENTWTDNSVLVGLPGLPESAVTGPITLATAGCAANDSLCRDSTDDTRGPVVPLHPPPQGSIVADGSFEVNNTARPGLCSVKSPPADQARGGWGTAVALRGAQFGATPGAVLFGGLGGAGVANWTDTSAQTAVIPIDYETFGVQVLNTEGIASNALPYEVLSPLKGTLPEILSITPPSGGVGTGISILGNNFGDLCAPNGAPCGSVYFVHPTSGVAVLADVNFPSQCGTTWWTPHVITVKVPQGLSIGTIYNVQVYRYDQQSAGKDFEVTNTTPGPFLACIRPTGGPLTSRVSVYGENFGNSVIADRGLFFTRKDSPDPPVAFDPVTGARSASWVSARATPTNIGGVPNDTCPLSGWSGNKACAALPNDPSATPPNVARTGAVIVEQDIDDVTRYSNPLLFTVGSCRAPVGPLYLNCGSSLICCLDGSCNSPCPTFVTPVSAYGWQFSTSPKPLVPEVIAQCDTFEDGGIDHPEFPPSPSPAAQSGRNKDVNVCVNAAVAVTFNTPVLPATLNATNIKLQKCTGTQELLTGNDSSFAGTTAKWAHPPHPTDVVAQLENQVLDAVLAPGEGRNPNDTDTYALHLTKLDDDTGPGWANETGIQQNYEHWFGYQANAIENTNGKTYTATAWVRAGNAAAFGKRAGILIQRDGSALAANTPNAWQKASQETMLTESWRQVSVSLTFDAHTAPGFVRVFMEGAPYDLREGTKTQANDAATIAQYSDPAQLFAMYVDDVQVTGDPCTAVEANTVDANLIDEYPGDIGFRYYSSSDFDPNTWYRVTLIGGASGIKAQDIGVRQGQGMEVLKDAPARCGDASAAYCFRFKTKNEPNAQDNLCKVGGIAVVPKKYTARAENEMIEYSAVPVAAGDPCVIPKPGSYAWAWQSTDTAKATVSYNPGASPPHIGHACATDADCSIGALPACVSGYCTQMGWTTTATAIAETELDQQTGKPIPVHIQATTENKTGQGDLTVEFEPPRVISYWPSCADGVCTNAGMGAQFSKAMVNNSGNTAAVTNKANVQVWSVPCGNGALDPGEDCDDGNIISGDGCSSACVHEGSNFALRCGDGNIDLFEDCDDNNLTNGDGCSDKCLNEGTNTPICGNSTVGIGEDCDDGNRQDGDGCSSKCLHEGTRSDIPICGNKRLDRGEECEKQADETFAPWCSSTTCLRQGPQPAALCGNGRVDAGEECDDNMPLLDSVAKKALCADAGTQYPCQWTGTLRPASPVGQGCGNRKIEIGEDCDDGNLQPGDGCDGACRNEGSSPGTIPACGNGGTADAGEDCDDGNTVSGDGCSSKCLNEGRPSATCGNGGKPEIGEDCDDRNTTNNDGCSSICANEGTAAPVCGNGALDNGEDCDDKNVANGDGCSNVCKNEGRPAESVNSNDLILTWDTNTNAVSIDAGMLNPNTNYRVLLRGADNPATTVQVEGLHGLASGGALGKTLSNLNFIYNWEVSGAPHEEGVRCSLLPSAPVDERCNTFSWTFKTKDLPCGVDRVEVNPAQASLYVIGARQPYSSQPYGPPDSCSPQGQKLNQFIYNWSWDTQDQVIATIVNQPGVNTIPSCGDGISEQGEDCDDGNTFADDGCDEFCLNEGSDFEFACGEGDDPDVVEECEKTSLEYETPWCSNNCLHRGSTPCPLGATTNCCGNEIVESGEDCDDGNNLASDGCSPICLNEGTSRATGQCGNGTVDHPQNNPELGGEECDPNETTGIRKYFCNPETCLLRGTLPQPKCGNGIIETGEECDEASKDCGGHPVRQPCAIGNVGDGCSADCLHEGSPRTCGNGKLDKGEDCDDGNAASGDSCSSACLNEGTKAEAGPVSPATLPETPPRRDPFQQARAEGIKKFCRSDTTPDFQETVGGQLVSCTSNTNCTTAGFGICAPTNPWSTTDVQATAGGKTGASPLTVYCVAKTDKDCPVPNGSASPTIGRGSDNCCYNRPTVTARTPTIGEVCRNALIRATFSQPMDQESLSGNFILARQYEDKCPAGTAEVRDNGQIISPNILRNSSFEQETPLAWTLEKDQTANAADNISRRELSSADQIAGTYAISAEMVETDVLAIEQDKAPPDGPSVTATQTVTLPANTSYTLSAKVRVISMGTVTESPIGIGLYKERTGADPYLRFARGPLTQTSGWVNVSGTFTTVEAGEYVVFVAIVGGETEALFDQVELRKVVITQAKSTHIFARAWRWIVELFKRLTPSARAQNPVWCVESDIELTTTAAQNGQAVILQPSKMLGDKDDPVTYRVGIAGDKFTATGEVVKGGLRSQAGVGFNGGAFGLDMSWEFTTGKDICTLDEVEVIVVPPDTAALTATAQTADVEATAYTSATRTATQSHERQPIYPVPGYSWAWSWGSSELETVTATNRTEQRCGGKPYGATTGCSATNPLSPVTLPEQTVTAGTKDGTAQVNATATITEDFVRPESIIQPGICREISGALKCANNSSRTCVTDQDCGEQAGQTRVGFAEFSLFRCDNPWPADATTTYYLIDNEEYGTAPVIDAHILGTERPLNFRTHYCRDGATLLPELSYPPPVLIPLITGLFPKPKNAYYIASSHDNPAPQTLKEILLTAKSFTQGVSVPNGVRQPANDIRENNGSFPDYTFNFPEPGDYEIAVETSNYDHNNDPKDDDLSNLAAVLEAKNIPDAVRAALRNRSDDVKELTGAYYHRIQISLDGAVKGFVVNQAGSETKRNDGRLILRGVSKGDHAVKLTWTNEDETWTNEDKLPSAQLIVDGTTYAEGSIWDPNLKIHKVTLRRGRVKDDAIGIRVLSNPERLPLAAWYNRMGFGGTPSPTPAPIDGYQALQEGNTIYIAATNATTDTTTSPPTKKVFDNVYLISLSEGAPANLKVVFDELIENLKFNVNLENLKTCEKNFCANNPTQDCEDNNDDDCETDGVDGLCVQKSCVKDLDCATGETVVCRSDREKLARDIIRIQQVTAMQAALAGYKARTGRYPTLEAGTFIRSLSTSKWPSWNATFGSALGAPLPQDPIDRFGAPCVSGPTEKGTYNPATCWNEQMQKYICPKGSHIYQYQSLGGVGYKLSSAFELVEKVENETMAWDVYGWDPSTGEQEVDTSGGCEVEAAGTTWSNATAVCGNRIIELPESGNLIIEPPEICELGTENTAVVNFAPGGEKRCTGNPSVTCPTLAENTPCPLDGDGNSQGLCQKLTSCTARRECKSDCSNWNDWPGGTVDAADCSPGGTFCGNGLREDIDLNNDGDTNDSGEHEVCDDGLLNGNYGKCNATCTGLAAHCGDGIKTGAEVCDRQTYNFATETFSTAGTAAAPSTACVNGDYGCCKFDCGGPAQHCGDTFVNGTEQCELGNTGRSAGRCRIVSSGALTATPCTSNAQCDPGQTCAICGPAGTLGGLTTTLTIQQKQPEEDVALDTFEIFLDGSSIGIGTAGYQDEPKTFTLPLGTHSVIIKYKNGYNQGHYQLVWGSGVSFRRTPIIHTSAGATGGSSLYGPAAGTADDYTVGRLHMPQALPVGTILFGHCSISTTLCARDADCPLAGETCTGRSATNGCQLPNGDNGTTAWCARTHSTDPGYIQYDISVSTTSAPTFIGGYSTAFERTCTSGCTWGASGGWSSSCVQTGERCGDGTTNGTEQCDDGQQNTADANNNSTPDGDEDGCLNNCTRAQCGDGKNQIKVCTTGTDAQKGRPCTTNEQCGTGGVCQDPEDCDLGAQNGVPCTPQYGGNCTYCDNQCNAITRTGGFCGNTIYEPPSEQCEGTQGLSYTAGIVGAPKYVCKGTVGTNEYFGNFATVADVDAWVEGNAVAVRHTPGYNSTYTMRIDPSANAGEVRYRFPDTDGKTYVASAWVNTDQTTGSQGVRLIMDREGAPNDTEYKYPPDSSPNSYFQLDHDPNTWQYIELTAAYDAGPNRAYDGWLRIRVENYDDDIHVDQVRLRPGPPTCTANNCTQACRGGSFCQNKLKQCSGGNNPTANCTEPSTVCTGGTCTENNFDRENILQGSVSYKSQPTSAVTNLSSGQYAGDRVSDTCDNDQDNDNYPASTDCNDNNAKVNPDATELCNNAVDEDCNSATDCVAVTLQVSDYSDSNDTFCVYLDDQLIDFAYGGNAKQTSVTSLLPGQYDLEILFHHSDGFIHTHTTTLAGGLVVSIPHQHSPNGDHSGTYRFQKSSNISFVSPNWILHRSSGSSLSTQTGTAANNVHTGTLHDEARKADAVETGSKTAVCSDSNGTIYKGLDDAGSVTYKINVTP